MEKLLTTGCKYMVILEVNIFSFSHLYLWVNADFLEFRYFWGRFQKQNFYIMLCIKQGGIMDGCSKNWCVLKGTPKAK